MPLNPTEAALHDVIHLVYESALDPSQWSPALQSMCKIFGGMEGSISVLDTTTRDIRFAVNWSEDPDWPRWRELLHEKYAAVMPFYGTPSFFEVDEVFNTEMQAAACGVSDVYETPFFKEWALPSGRRDNIGSIVMKTPTRFGAFAIHTSTKRGLVTPEELDFAAILVPHVRRAVTIGDLLDVTSSTAVTLQATLDKLSTAVVMTDRDARIVHCNAAGEAMLVAGGPINSISGLLNTQHSETTAALRRAISETDDPARKLGSKGIGVPLRNADGEAAIAHVLPLNGKTSGIGSVPRARAAIFIAPSEHLPPTTDTLVALYGLTAMEARVLMEIVKGRKRADAAVSLGIADSTAKTHLDRVFSKTGTSDQATLARLVASLSSPARDGA